VTTLLLILVVFPLMIILGGVLEGNTAYLMGGLTWQSFTFSIWEEFICVGMILVLLVWFREKVNHQGAVAKAMSDSTFTVYFIHPLVLVFLALALKPIHMYPLLKWALVSLLATFLCFTMAYVLRKMPLMRKIL
jgi:surface polysaccharide O-acyltransferase-like enzyme